VGQCSALAQLFSGTDFGGARPHAHIWLQVLNQELELPSAQRRATADGRRRSRDEEIFLANEWGAGSSAKPDQDVIFHSPETSPTLRKWKEEEAARTAERESREREIYEAARAELDAEADEAKQRTESERQTRAARRHDSKGTGAVVTAAPRRSGG
jgi:hypothetical protein